MYDKSKLWDKKSKTFPRYTEQPNAVQKGVFEVLARWGVEFKGKTLIDVGCGTGVWTLHLARVAKRIIALDSSHSMLEVLKDDALKLNLNNIDFVNSTFEAFYKAKNAYELDIAFVSMSPALNKNEDYQAFFDLAPLRVFVGWEEYRQSDFMQPIFKAFNAKQKCFNGDDIEIFLNTNGVKFEKKVFEEVRQNEKPRQIAIENAMWHLNMADIEVREQELEKLIKGELIKEVVKSKIKLLVF